jgi:hypothetical protein
MKTKHTKGEWNAVIYDGAFDQPLIRCNSTTIARVHGQLNRQHEANAKLIAAAPELLESLVKILDNFKSCIEGGNGQLETDAEDISKAEAVIKKATE